MRRLLPVLCFAILAVGLLLGYEPSGSPDTALATRPGGSPFPPVWSLQAAPDAVAAATSGIAARRQADVEQWYAVAVWNETAARNAAAAALTRSDRARSYARRSPSLPAPTTSTPGTGRCGGDLPPCSVMMCESGGSLTAHNAHSTASGKWQVLDSTWNGYGGYARASDAPEAVQDAKARALYAGGAGRGQWVC